MANVHVSSSIQNIHSWNRIVISFCIVIATGSGILFGTVQQVESLIIRENPVRLRVLEYSNKNGSLQKVLNSRFSDLVVGEEVEENSQIVLECSSLLGPLRWIYSGDGQPQHKSFYSSTSTRSSNTNYIAYLSFPNGLGARDTGQYSCQNAYNGSVSNYVYLFIPKGMTNENTTIFIPNGRKHEVAISASDKTARIPCSVVHPNVKVSLERVSPKQSFYLDPPTEVPYSPKRGFTVPIIGNTKEKFTCRGEYNGTTEEVTYTTAPQQPRIESEAERIYLSTPEHETTNTSYQPSPSISIPVPENVLKSACTPQFCGLNAECIVKDYNPYCVCFEDYTGNPKKACHKISAMSQHLRVADPCQPSPCGKHSECIEVNGHPLCTCKEGYYGSPPGCQPTKFTNCSKNYDCEWTEYCNTETFKCEDICEGSSIKFCGKNAHCTAFSHMPYCTCPPGGSYVGDPYDTEGVGCQPQSERLQAEGKPSCNPSPCGVNAHCKVYSSYPLPICFCPQGFTGDPSHRCYKVAPPPVDVFRPHHIPITSPKPELVHQPENTIRLCTPTSCGENARCRIRQNNPECHCLRGYRGDPYKACHRKAISPSALRQACSVCGPNSVCSMVATDVRCICAPETIGAPPNCKRVTFHAPLLPHPQVVAAITFPFHPFACLSDLDCPDDKVCYTPNNKCLNPCSWACSESADCSVRNHLPHCICPPGYTGDPHLQCVRELPLISHPPSHQPLTVPDSHPCRFNCGPNTVCRRVSVEEMRFLRKKALSMSTLEMENDPFQRALFHYLKQANSLSFGKNENGDIQQSGFFSECVCQRGAMGNPYSIEGCSFAPQQEESSNIVSVISNFSSLEPPGDGGGNLGGGNDGIFSDLQQSSSSSSAVVIQVDPCKPTNPCGEHSLCVAFKGQVFCRCDYDSVGEPPNCMLRCGSDNHCLFDQVCLYGKCVLQHDTHSQSAFEHQHESNSL